MVDENKQSDETRSDEFMEDEIGVEYVVDRETAKKDFTRWLRVNRLRIARPNMDKNDRSDYMETKEVIIQEIMEGRIVIDTRGHLVFTPGDWNHDPLVFYRLKAGDMHVIDKKREHEDMAKGVGALAAITKTSEPIINDLDANDFILASGVMSLFLAR